MSEKNATRTSPCLSRKISAKGGMGRMQGGFQFLPVCFKSHCEVYLHMYVCIHTYICIYTHMYTHLIRYYMANNYVYTCVCV